MFVTDAVLYPVISAIWIRDIPLCIRIVSRTLYWFSAWARCLLFKFAISCKWFPQGVEFQAIITSMGTGIIAKTV